MKMKRFSILVICILCVSVLLSACGLKAPKKDSEPAATPAAVQPVEPVQQPAASTPAPEAPVAEPTPAPTPEPTPAPTPEPTPTPTPAPTEAPPPGSPTVTKSPTNETVVEGGSCYFVAKYIDATWAVWHFVSPDGNTDLTYEEAQKEFASMEIIDGMYSTMQLQNIPLAANGWSVYCRYSNKVGSVDTARATITVNPKS